MSKRKINITIGKNKKPNIDLELDDIFDDEIINIKHDIKSIDDLIYLGNQYMPNKRYNINLKKLYNLVPVLIKLKNIIGMDNIKQNITNQIIYFIQDFQDKNSDMLHTVIQGPPGVGKTMLGEIIGEIYYKLDIIEKNDSDSDYDNNLKFTIAKRSDLIGKYLGHTAAKTQEVINRSLGGVLFIDEAYSLGNEEGRDSYSKECIDTINQNLTEKKNKLLVIIAGYKDALDNCFFNYNEGLRRRFPFVYTIDSYNSNDLSRILCLMIKKLGSGWDVIIEQETLDKFFKENIQFFPNYAGDIETLLFSIKIEHSRRVLFLDSDSDAKRKINITDVENALKTFKANKEKINQPKTKSTSHLMMYV